MKIEERVQNLNENMRNNKTKCCFTFAKQLETLFSYFCQFRETIETWRNSYLFRTVAKFVKLKKYETVKPNQW